MKERISILALLFIFLFAGGLIYYLYTDISSRGTISSQVGEFAKDSQDKPAENTLLGTGTEVIEGIEFEEYGRNTPALSTNRADIPIPDLDREIVFYEETMPEAQEKITKRIKEITNVLKENNDAFTYWIEFGQYWKLVGDYEGARDAWEYASAIRPKNSLSFGNLGDLYGYYIRDFALAESNFLAAIENAPQLIYLYAQAAIFQKDVRGDLPKAREMIELGIANNPENIDLKAALKELQEGREI